MSVFLNPVVKGSEGVCGMVCAEVVAEGLIGIDTAFRNVSIALAHNINTGKLQRLVGAKRIRIELAIYPEGGK